MENKSKLNKVMLIVFILALFVGLVTLFIIINKGNIFGKRLVEISGEVVEKEITHSIEMTCDKKYLAIDTEDVANLLVTAVPIGGGTISEMFIITMMGFPVAALPILTIIATIIDAPATVLNSVGDSAASMLVARFVDGKNWLDGEKKETKKKSKK